VLVLNTHDAEWRISSGPDTRIVGVILSGYEASRVEGVAPDTPLLVLAWRDMPALPKLDPACAPFTDYVGLAYRRGPGALALDRQVRALTGRGIDGLLGARRLKEVTIP
jgi:hypothetical protein